ncbi:hypothetical protein [Endozoicomonas sp. ONNA2]|uniref:hypothetical protein n=1 Tax=Endozoicomonas sp. ONNA2 TaxID=2828741 RepID=UPI002147FFE3|nr:hypothetical protein [Endozoicomonas sp. ONNA2]
MASYLKDRITENSQLAIAVDFHSMEYDLFYTMSDDYPLAPRNLVNDWLNAMDKKTATRHHVSQLAMHNKGSGVFKQYIADTYRVQGVTYEVSDNACRPLIRQNAKDAAETFIITLNGTKAEDFQCIDNGKSQTCH